MKNRNLTIFLFFLISCNTPSNNIAVEKVRESIETLRQDSLIASRDTFAINNQQIIRIIRKNKFEGLITISGDSIIKFKDYYSKANFLDINEDGYKDIRVFILSNMPNQCENYFFDKDQNKYKLIENCDTDIQLINGTKVFYSYYSVGCSDMNWESNLSKIENWKAVNIGLLSANGCGDKNDGIKIYKINGPTEQLIKTLSIINFDNNGSKNKWDFIKNYWSRNYNKFE